MNTAADFDDAVLGLELAPEVESALAEAGVFRSSDPPRARAALARAQHIAPEHPAVLIALYRDHFYGHRPHEAREVSRRALLVAAQALDVPSNWREVPRRALAGARFDAATRFYLFVLKGYAYLSLRLHDAAEARDALALLRVLDPDDCVGAAVLESVRQHAAAGGDGDEPAPYVQATGAAAWARLSTPTASEAGHG